MELTLNWLVDSWKTFSIWTSTQPTFVQVALGMALFFVTLQALRLSYRIAVYTLTGLFAGRGRSKAKKNIRPPSRLKKNVTMDDDAPPFVFR